MCVLLDTSFFIRLLNPEDALHQNTLEYFQYFLENQITLKISTIAIAEYCVKGDVQELPLKDLQIVPFNFNHAIKAGKMAAIIFENRNKLDSIDRKIIPNDSKLFAQAEIETQITKFATADEACMKVYNVLNQINRLSFDILNIRRPISETLGILF